MVEWGCERGVRHESVGFDIVPHAELGIGGYVGVGVCSEEDVFSQTESNAGGRVIDRRLIYFFIKFALVWFRYTHTGLHHKLTWSVSFDYIPSVD